MLNSKLDAFQQWRFSFEHPEATVPQDHRITLHVKCTMRIDPNPIRLFDLGHHTRV